MTDLIITHTHQDGTLIDGTARNDGTGPALKTNRWRWSRGLGAWFVPQSRDRLAKTAVINSTVTALEAAGFTVEVQIDDVPRATAIVEADKIVRADARAAALADKANRKEAKAESLGERAKAALDQLPPMGEPIKIGHHSEGRHRRALDRAHRTWALEMQAHEDAAEADRRAREAAAATGARYNPITVANRIEKLAAEVRASERQETAGRTMVGLERQRNELEFWQDVRSQQIIAGEATNYGPDTVKPGDHVKLYGTWFRVVRANQKTVRLTGSETRPTGGTVPWYKLSGHAPAEKDAK